MVAFIFKKCIISYFGERLQLYCIRPPDVDSCVLSFFTDHLPIVHVDKWLRLRTFLTRDDFSCCHLWVCSGLTSLSVLLRECDWPPPPLQIRDWGAHWVDSEPRNSSHCLASLWYKHISLYFYHFLPASASLPLVFLILPFLSSAVILFFCSKLWVLYLTKLAVERKLYKTSLVWIGQ